MSTRISELTDAQVQRAVESLLQLKQKTDNKKLLDNDEAVNLQFTMKKVPGTSSNIKLQLPHGLAAGKTPKEVCLFVKDLDRKDREFEQTVIDTKRELKSKGVKNVSEVIPLKALKLEYKTFEAKRMLVKSYDTFLADARIMRLLPSYLGKAFFAKKRQPVQVRMDAKDLKAEFDAAINNSRCLLNGRGSVGMAAVASTEMSAVEITQNIMASAEQITAAIPGGANNIKSFHIKTPTSLAIPIQISLGSANDVVLEVKEREREPVVAEEVSTVEDSLVKVFPSGVVQLCDESGKRKRRRHHNTSDTNKVPMKKKRKGVVLPKKKAKAKK